MLFGGLKPIIVCSTDNLGLSLTYFTTMSKFSTYAFIWESVTMIDSLVIIASCDLEVG